MESLSTGNSLKRNAERADLPGGGHLKGDSLPSGKKTKGRVKIKMEFIDNKLRRYTTFSKRKTGIMKKAYELSTLTGTQVMLLVASETGHVYTFATRKLQPMITSDAGKALIQTCLNSPEEGENEGRDGDQRMSAAGFEETDFSYDVEDKADMDGEAVDQYEDEEDVDDGGSEGESNDTNDTPTNLSTHPHSSQSESESIASSGSVSFQPVGLMEKFGDPPSIVPSCLPLSNPVTQTPVLRAPGFHPDKPSKPYILAPSLSPEVLAQLGYTNLLAQASSSSHKLLSNSSTTPPSSSPHLLQLLPREPIPVSTLVKLEPNQSPENLSLQKNRR